jgi:hypothetical protein
VRLYQRPDFWGFSPEGSSKTVVYETHPDLQMTEFWWLKLQQNGVAG